MRAFLFQRWGRCAAAALIAGLMAACGGDGNGVATQTQDAPLATFTQQKLDWQACDPEMLGEDVNQALALYGKHAQCALMRVPMDYDNPAGAELKIEVLRVTGTQPTQRLGAIVFNPGGPGVNGLMTAVYTGFQLMASDDARLQEMAGRYDLIGFSPRGTGASNPLNCDAAGTFAESGSYTFNRSAENLQAVQHNARLQAEACLSNPLTQHIHTDATARDMDLLRAVLGESKLNYIGYSYGSWLGAWYARLFPDRVGRMLLDGVDNIADSLAWVSDKGLGPQRILDQVMLPYAARHDDKLGLGDAATLRNALLALSPELQEVLFENIEFATSSKIQDGILWMSAAVGLHALMQAHPDADEEAMRILIESHDAFSPVPRINAGVKKFALALVDKLTGDDGDDAAVGPDTMAMQDADGRVRILPTFNVLMSVRCNESAKVGDAQYWLDKSHEDVLRYPTAGGFAAGNFCAHWTLPTRPFPAATTTENAPLLMLQSRYDGHTPIEGAMATLAALPQARMIVVEDEYQHGVFPYGTQCVDRQVADYFLDGTLPQRLSSCAGKPLGGAVNGTSPSPSE